MGSIIALSVYISIQVIRDRSFEQKNKRIQSKIKIIKMNKLLLTGYIALLSLVIVLVAEEIFDPIKTFIISVMKVMNAINFISLSEEVATTIAIGFITFIFISIRINDGDKKSSN
jgi:hypothetical protein